MRTVQLIVSVEIDDETHAGCLENLDYIEFGGRQSYSGWGDRHREVGEPDENSVHSDGPLAKIVDARLLDMTPNDEEPRRCGMD